METHRQSAYQCWSSMETYRQNIHFRRQYPLTRLTKPKVAPAKQNENQALPCHTDHPLVFGLRLFKKFGNDHFGAIMGYGDCVIGDSVISRVYYVEGLGHNLFSVGQFCDSDLEVAFMKHSCYVRDT
ncbi:hypothetical protein Tco_1518865, partial [Tanacetum coccineum]